MSLEERVRLDSEWSESWIASSGCAGEIVAMEPLTRSHTLLHAQQACSGNLVLIQAPASQKLCLPCWGLPWTANLHDACAWMSVLAA